MYLISENTQNVLKANASELMDNNSTRKYIRAVVGSTFRCILTQGLKIFPKEDVKTLFSNISEISTPGHWVTQSVVHLTLDFTQVTISGS